MIGRKFDPNCDQYSEHYAKNGAEPAAATLPSLFAVNSVPSPILTSKPRYLRANSQPSPPVAGHKLDQARKSLDNEHLLIKPQPYMQERAMALIGSPISANSSTSQLELNHSNQDVNQEETNTEKVKIKLMSLWNNVKYGWQVKLKTSFSHDTPIWLLGVLYHRNLLDSGSGHGPGSRFYVQRNQQHATKESALDLFKHDYYSRIWFTYRRAFPKLEGSQVSNY